MKMISEQTISAAAEALDLPSEGYEEVIREFGENQPVLLSYVFSEDLQVFTDEERSYLLYLLLVIWKSIQLEQWDIPEISETRLINAEEQNWSLMHANPGGSFRKKLDVFFENYTQEDLLAFVEDALTEDEEDQVITSEGREALFVILKSVIDCLTAVDLIH